MKKCILLIVLTVLTTFAGLAYGAEKTVTLMSHNSFNMSKDVLKSFERANDVTLKLVKAGDGGEALSQAILSKNNPLGDVFFGVDNTFMSRALKAGIFVPYNSPALATIPDKLKLDKTNALLPVDFGDVCLNYDKGWFAAKNMAPPTGLDDLIKPQYKNLTVVQNPATSSPGLAFLLTTIGMYGPDKYLDYWKKLRINGVHVSAGWNDAYFGRFTRAKGGDRPIVVSYASSPPVEVFFSKIKLNDSPTAVVLSPKSSFRQIEFVGILKNCKEPELARKLVDFMLSPKFQKDIPLNMYVFPAVEGIPLPELFTKYTEIATDPVVLDPAQIEKNREKWIDDWTTVVLR